MTLNNRHQQCHPEVNSVLRVPSQALRGITKHGRNTRREIRKCWWHTELGRHAGKQQPHRFIHFCSAGFGHVWGVQSCCSVFTLDYRDSSSPRAVLPAEFSASPLRHAPAQTWLIHTHTQEHGLLRPLGTWALSGHQSQRWRGRSQPLVLHKHDPLTWTEISGTKSVLWVQLLLGVKCCHSFCSTLLGMIHGTEGMVRFFFYLLFPWPICHQTWTKMFIGDISLLGCPCASFSLFTQVW